MRRLISTVFTLVLLILVGYNALQVSMLRREVATLKTEIRTLKAGEHGDQKPEADIKSALAELEKNVQSMQHLYQDAGSQSKEVRTKIRRALEDMRAVIERLWQQTDNEPRETKGG